MIAGGLRQLIARGAFIAKWYDGVIGIPQYLLGIAASPQDICFRVRNERIRFGFDYSYLGIVGLVVQGD